MTVPSPLGGGPLGGRISSGSSSLTVSDSITISDSAQITAVHLHASASDSITLSDGATFSGTIAPQPSVYKRMPGIGSRATPRTRNPVNAPRYFGHSAVKPIVIRALVYNTSDSISISDAATRAGLSTSRTASDGVSISDRVTPSLKALDAITISDSVAGKRNPSDSISVSDAVQRQVSASRTAFDTITFTDTGVGTTGRSNVTSSDSIPVSDAPLHGPNASDSFSLSDLASAGIVFFGANDTIIIGDSVTGVPAFNRAFVYQYGLEIAEQTPPDVSIFQFGTEVAEQPPSTAFVYQNGIEVAKADPTRADLYEFALEVAIGKIYGQIWPIGWGIPRQTAGQMWPRLSTRNPQ